MKDFSFFGALEELLGSFLLSLFFYTWGVRVCGMAFFYTAHVVVFLYLLVCVVELVHRRRREREWNDF